MAKTGVLNVDSEQGNDALVADYHQETKHTMFTDIVQLNTSDSVPDLLRV
jgi:hypothetical protein